MAFAFPQGVDIQRAPRKKSGRYFAFGGGFLALVVVTLVLSRLKPAAPTVDAPWIDVVKRGPMVRQVRGPGTLVPEQIRYISAVTSGRVESVPVRPGDHVQAGTVLVRMTNPDVQLEMLTALQQLAASQASLVSLRSNLETQRLNQASTVANTRTLLREAVRQAASSESLATRNLIAANDVARVRDQVTEYTERLQIEEQRLRLMTATADSQLVLQREQVERQRAVAEYQQQRVASMNVVAGVDGVVQDLTLQPGQWVQSGATLARVLQPGRLKAELKIPETQARDVALGQNAEIDTHIGVVPGKVIRIDPNSQNGTVTVDVSLDGPLPQGARPDLSIEGVVEIERLASVLSTGRPAYGQPGGTVGLFRVVRGTGYAERTNVRLGRSSVNTIEILGGLAEGDSVLLSDMSRWDNVDRVKIK